MIAESPCRPYSVYCLEHNNEFGVMLSVCGAAFGLQQDKTSKVNAAWPDIVFTETAVKPLLSVPRTWPTYFTSATAIR